MRDPDPDPDRERYRDPLIDHVKRHEVSIPVSVHRVLTAKTIAPG